MDRELRKRALFALAAAIVCAALIFPGLGGSSLDGDEALYASIVRDSWADGRLLPLTLRDDAYFNKPPGGFALELAAMRLLGDSETALRLPSAIFGLATCLWVFWTGARWFGDFAGLVAAAALAATSTALSRHAFRGATFDALLLLLATIAISGGLAAVCERRKLVQGRWLVPALATIGLKFLAGPAFVAASLLFAGGAASAVERSRASFRRAAIAAAAVFGSAVVLLAVWIVVTRDEHLLAVFRHDLFRRLTGDLPRVPQRPWHYFFGRLLIDFGPLLALPFLLVVPAIRKAVTAERSRIAACIGWGLTLPLLLAAFGSKLNWYVLPSYPGIALAIGAAAAALAGVASGFRLQATRVALALLLAWQCLAGWRSSRERDRLHPLSRLADALAERPEAAEARLFVEPGLGFQFDPDDVVARPFASLHGIEEYYYLGRLQEGRAPAWPPVLEAGKCPVVVRSSSGSAGNPGLSAPDPIRLRAWRQGPDLLISDPCGLAAALSRKP